MSETAMLTSNPCKPRDGTRRIGTVGPALPGVQLRIVDDAGQPVADGEIGGIQVKGPNVFQGYWQMPGEDRRRIHGRRLLQDRRRGQT